MIRFVTFLAIVQLLITLAGTEAPGVQLLWIRVPWNGSQPVFLIMVASSLAVTVSIWRLGSRMNNQLRVCVLLPVLVAVLVWITLEATNSEVMTSNQSGMPLRAAAALEARLNGGSDPLPLIDDDLMLERIRRKVSLTEWRLRRIHLEGTSHGGDQIYVRLDNDQAEAVAIIQLEVTQLGASDRLAVVATMYFHENTIDQFAKKPYYNRSQTFGRMKQLGLVRAFEGSWIRPIGLYATTLASLIGIWLVAETRAARTSDTYGESDSEQQG